MRKTWLGVVLLWVAVAAVAQGPGTLTGVVVDEDHAEIVGATVTVSSDAEAGRRTVKTGADGRFVLSVGEEHLKLTFMAQGFEPLVREYDAHLSQLTDVGAVTLMVGEVETVDAISPHEMAEQQIKVEESQRVLGVIPDFLTSYIPNPAPLSAGQKFKLSARVVYDPVIFAEAAAFAGINQAADSPHEWGKDGKGYAQRYGAGYAGAFTGIMFSGAVYPALFHQDPRFFMGEGTRKQRFVSAVKQVVEQKGDNGKWQVGWSNLCADMTASVVVTAIYPHVNTDWGKSLATDFGLNLAGGLVSNLLEEFVIRHITKRKQP